MGQRLNMEITENEKVLANAYYHWSGYTSSSLNITQEVLDSIEKISCEDKVVKAIKLLEVTGAGLTDEEREYAKKKLKDYDNYSFIDCTGRNDGLIAVSEQGIENTRRWEEARVEIDIVNQIINFKVIYKLTKAEIEEDYDDVKFDEIPVLDIDFSKVTFDKFVEFKELILGLISKAIYQVKLNGDEKVYGFIE
jgi:hypothetical protein